MTSCLWENSMQMRYSLYRRFLVDLAYKIEPVVNAFQVVSFMRKKRHSTKCKVVKDNKTPGIKATISTWKVIDIQFNFALWLTDWMPKHEHRHKNFAGRFCLPPQPNGATQNYYSERIAIQSVQKKNWSTLNFMLQENASSWQCVVWMDKRTYVSLIHMSILTTIYWIYLLRPSPLIFHIWPCFHALYGQMPAIIKPPTKCVKL